MDILLRNKYTYNLPGSFEETKEKLRTIFSDRSSNFSTDLSGTIDEDGSFNLRSNFSFFSAVSYGQTIYFKGQILPGAEGTTINIYT
jgi:hypothetical protein